MKNIYQTIFLVVITFIVTLLLNFLTEYLTQDKGSILIGPAITNHGQNYLPISISNYTNQPIDNLILSVPVSTTISSIVASTAIQIEELPSSVGISLRKHIQLSGIEPSRITELLIPITMQTESDDFSVINAHKVRLGVQPIQNIQSPTSIALKNALYNSAFLIVIYIVILLWMNSQFKANDKKLAELQNTFTDKTKEYEKDDAKLKKQVEDLLTETNRVNTVDIPNMKNSYRKVNILTMSRLSDYAKELDFWRDTIRKIMYQATGDSNVAEKLIMVVTENLKTYSTLNLKAPSVYFESLEILASYIREEERE